MRAAPLQHTYSNANGALARIILPVALHFQLKCVATDLGRPLPETIRAIRLQPNPATIFAAIGARGCIDEVNYGCARLQTRSERYREELKVHLRE